MTGARLEPARRASSETHFGEAGTTKTELGTKAAEGAGVGGAIGGTLGAIAAAVAAVGTSIAIPGLGLVIAGPLAAAIAGAGAGGAAGGLVGALIGWGIPEERIKRYESGIKSGGFCVPSFARRDYARNDAFRPGRATLLHYRACLAARQGRLPKCWCLVASLPRPAVLGIIGDTRVLSPIAVQV